MRQKSMKTTLLGMLCAILLLGAGQAAGAGTDEFVLVNSAYPPYVMPAGDLKGPGIDMEIALRILERLGIHPTVRLVPFKRVLAMLEDGQADMTTSLSLRPERDAYLLWSIPYRTGTSYAFFTRKDSSFAPEKLEDLRGRTVGVVRGFVFPKSFTDDAAIGKGEAPHMESLVGMLLQGRFDAIIVNSLAGRFELLGTGRMDDVRQAPFTISTPDDAGTVMGFSKARGHQELVIRFNAELEKMRADGTIHEIEQSYLK